MTETTSTATEESTETKDWTERLREGFERLSPAESRKRAIRAARAGVEFQKKSILSTLDGIERLQSKTEERVQKFTQDSSYLPDEGKVVVEEWIALAQKSRHDFKESTDKSYGLLLQYFDRIEKKDEAAE